jgi:leader peptidase (prepilin peptidase)/N-methyltransferase
MSELLAALHEWPPLFVALALVVGLLIGSFLNVVIHRVPRMMERDWRAQCAELAAETSAAGDASAASGAVAPRYDLLVPRSSCPGCGAPIKAWHNVPVLSWLLLRGRCAACRAPISPRYPIVEAVAGLASAYVAWHFGFGAEALCALIVTWFLIALTGIDIDTQLLPDSLTLPLLWLGLLASVWPGPAGGPLPVSTHDAILGATTGYLSLWSVYQLFKLLTGKEGMGYGDFKLLAALGAWLGWQMLLPVILLSALTGSVVGVALIVLRRHGRDIPIPFGPYLAAAGWLAMLWGPGMVQRYLHYAGAGP